MYRGPGPPAGDRCSTEQASDFVTVVEGRHAQSWTKHVGLPWIWGGPSWNGELSIFVNTEVTLSL